MKDGLLKALLPNKVRLKKRICFLRKSFL